MSRLKLWNESGTNRARIADSLFPGFVPCEIWIFQDAESTKSGVVAAGDIGSGGKSANRRQRTGQCGVKTDSADYCVFETVRGGAAVVTNWVASSTAVPIGVGTDSRNGASTRVPAIGASQTSMLRWATRYLIAARSGI